VVLELLGLGDELAVVVRVLSVPALATVPAADVRLADVLR
jgi:hypothetical protein